MPIQPPLWVENFLSDDKYYFGFIIITTIIFMSLYAYYKHQSYEGGWSAFRKSKQFTSKVILTSVFALFIAMEIYMRISMYFEKSRYKVLAREIHQMIATDKNRTYDPYKLYLYKKLARDRSDQERFIDPIMYQKSDTLKDLEIMKLNAPYVDPDKRVFI
jgi:hypothetical protein